MPRTPPDRGLPSAPRDLEPVYRLFAARYSGSGLVLATYPGRWLAFLASEAAVTTALALADEEAGSADGFVRFRGDAIAAAGGAEVVLVKLGRHAFRSASPQGLDVEVLSIVVESSVQRVGLMGGVVLDALGRPARVHEPLPLLLDWGPPRGTGS